MTIPQFAEKHDLPTGHAILVAWRAKGFRSKEAFQNAVKAKIPDPYHAESAADMIDALYDLLEPCTFADIDQIFVKALKTTLGYESR